MKYAPIFWYEWKHFIRTPFKVVAWVLFIIAGVYSLHNGAALYKKQMAEIEKINQQSDKDKQKYISYYDKGKKGPAERPWVDIETPFWAVWYSPSYKIKEPSPALVYSIGQTEQFGFYKRITFWSSPYDSDMAEEIANPERLQSGTLDFSFSVIYLLPLLLLIWLYNIKGSEADKGFLPLIYAQTGSQQQWLLARVGFYILLLFGTITGLLLYGGMLTGVFHQELSAMGRIFFWLLIYGAFWGIVFTWILFKGSSVLINKLKMVGVWLLLAFIIPAFVHQWVSIQYPPNLMTDFIDAQRDDQTQLFEQPDSVIQAQLNTLFPEIIKSKVAIENSQTNLARSRSSSALANELVKKSIAQIEADNNARNDLIRLSYWFNPVTFMQNKLNQISQTHYSDYKNYREEIQSMIDKQIKIMVLDTWNGVQVDKEKYLEYNEVLNMK